MHELSKAVKLTNELLQQKLGNYEYHKTNYTPEPWKYITNDTILILVVDDARVKVVGGKVFNIYLIHSKNIMK